MFSSPPEWRRKDRVNAEAGEPAPASGLHGAVFSVQKRESTNLHSVGISGLINRSKCTATMVITASINKTSLP